MAKKLRTQKKKQKRRRTNLEKRKILNYSEEQMLKAVNEVREGKPVAAAARDNGVPRVSLLYKAKGVRPLERRMGPGSVLKKEEEECLVQWIKRCARAGFPVNKDDLLDSVQRLLRDLNRPNNFVNGRPGRSWYKLFLQRNPSVSERIPQNLTISRNSVTSSDLTQWAENTLKYLTDNDYQDILDDPTRVFNGDESAFFLNPTNDAVLAPKGDRTIYQQAGSDEKECITVLLTANAEGTLAPPLLVLKYKRLPAEIANSIPPEWGSGLSESGWMTGATFYEFITNVFHPWLVQAQIELPVILFMDGHTSHLTLHVSQFCSENGIILIALYPNSTHLTQPMDVAVFSSLKASYRKIVHDWRVQNGKPLVKKRDFPPILDQAIRRIQPETIQSGFRKCGLCPWNPKEPTESLRVKENSVPEMPEIESMVQETSQRSEENKTKSALTLIHKLIGIEKVELFEASQEWSGSNEDKSLFLLWKALKEATNETAQEAIELPDPPCPFAEERTRSEIPPITQREDDEEPTNNDIRPEVSPVASTIAQQVTTSVKTPSSSIREVCPVSSTSVQEISTPVSISTPSPSSLNIPSPFKRVLIWPELPEKKTKRRNETLPSVVTSKLWQEYHISKAKKKLDMEVQKKSRAEERQKKKIEKQELQQKKKAAKKRKTPQTKVKNNKIARRGKRSKRESTSESEECEWEPSDESVCSAGVPLQDSDEGEMDCSPTENYLLHEQSEDSGNLNVTQDNVEEPQPSDAAFISTIFDLHGLDIHPEEIYAKSEEDNHQEKVEIIVSNEATFLLDVTDEEMMVQQPTVEETNSERNEPCKPKSNKTSPEIIHQKMINYEKTFEEGSFIVATFSNKKKDVESVCRVKTLRSDDSILVQTMRPVNRFGNVFHLDQKDERVISRNQISKILPKPSQFGSDFQFSFIDSQLL